MKSERTVDELKSGHKCGADQYRGTKRKRMKEKKERAPKPAEEGMYPRTVEAQSDLEKGGRNEEGIVEEMERRVGRNGDTLILSSSSFRWSPGNTGECSSSR